MQTCKPPNDLMNHHHQLMAPTRRSPPYRPTTCWSRRRQARLQCVSATSRGATNLCTRGNVATDSHTTTAVRDMPGWLAPLRDQPSSKSRRQWHLRVTMGPPDNPQRRVDNSEHHRPLHVPASSLLNSSSLGGSPNGPQLLCHRRCRLLREGGTPPGADSLKLRNSWDAVGHLQSVPKVA